MHIVFTPSSGWNIVSRAIGHWRLDGLSYFTQIVSTQLPHEVGISLPAELRITFKFRKGGGSNLSTHTVASMFVLLEQNTWDWVIYKW
jgi:hypothetical protein